MKKWKLSFLENDSETAFSCPCQQGSSVIAYWYYHLPMVQMAEPWWISTCHVCPRWDAGNEAPSCPRLLLWSGELFVPSSRDLVPPVNAYRHCIPVHLWVHFQGFLSGNQPSRTVNRHLSHMSGAWLPYLLLPNQSQSKGLWLNPRNSASLRELAKQQEPRTPIH